jgi:hypothetical protein
MRTSNADWSTINLAELRKLPVYDVGAHGYRLQDGSGNGCAGDPPGFPTYYTRAVYTQQGNDPGAGYSMVIQHEGINYGIESIKWAKGDTWEKVSAKRETLMRRLWLPLPLEHPRTQAWIGATFAHHNHCYQVPELRAAGKSWSDAMLIWPGGTLGKTHFGTLKDVTFEIKWKTEREGFDKWKPEEQEKFIADIKAENDRIKRLCSEIATPENHDGTILVREYYPDFQPSAELIAAKFERPGNWWEVLASNPGPDKCPGQYNKAHPVNGSWCQFCGWHAQAESEAA